MAMIKNVDEKCNEVINQLGKGFTKDEYVDMFIAMYPYDWNKIKQRYYEHERKNKGKPHPMPRPRQYVLNVSGIRRRIISLY
ncbi:hypothetical protein [Neobacillus sp. PS3-40]|uniref:hypothetical protein n=1 Tax=Neobacillus sp. PS3-40 TaxID=3070679 RepID=UPI0027E025A1|nr:hypothetical protein [Neobacillus sp. PS3-40]WML44071.1 hypothetical protein RCG20_20195 [Neobacillus sp. PS3-40]